MQIQACNQQELRMGVWTSLDLSKQCASTRWGGIIIITARHIRELKRNQDFSVFSAGRIFTKANPQDLLSPHIVVAGSDLQQPLTADLPDPTGSHPTSFCRSKSRSRLGHGPDEVLGSQHKLVVQHLPNAQGHGDWGKIWLKQGTQKMLLLVGN